MAQVTTGIRKILSSPAIYDLKVKLIGGKTARQELVDNELRPGARDRVLDVGCGTAKILDYLPATVEYVGLDLSNDYIAAAREIYGERATFHCGRVEDVTKVSDKGFDLVLGLGLLHHLDDEVVVDLFRSARELLAPDGRFFAVDPCFEENQNLLARFLINMDRGQNVRYAEAYVGLASRVFSRVEHRLRRNRLRVPYTHIIMECRP